MIHSTRISQKLQFRAPDSGIRIDLYFGNDHENTGDLAGLFMDACEDKYRDAALWFTHNQYKAAFLKTLLQKADFMAAAFQHDMPFGLLYAFETSPESRAHNIHFLFTKTNLALALYCAKTTFYYLDMRSSSQIGLFPSCYGHILKFAEALGFERAGKLKDACFMKKYGKFKDGMLMTRNKNAHRRGLNGKDQGI